MKKIKFLVLFMAFLVLGVGFSVQASAEENSQEVLTDEEYTYLLKEVGHTKEEIAELPVEVAKTLVKERAVKKESTEVIEEFYEEKNSSSGEFTPMATIPSSQIKLGATAYKVTSDRSGYNKYYMYGNFEWLVRPYFTLVDAMTIGFPESSGFFLPMSGGSVLQHSHRVSVDPQGNGNWTDYTKYTPYRWESSAGVAGSFDIRGDTSKTKNKGYIGQYVYVSSGKHGTINVKFEYGHKTLGATPTVSVFPAGLAITPNSNTDTRAYGIELKY